MSAPRTTTTCAGCGEAIPPAIVGDALCVRCRYDVPKTWHAWDSGGELPGSQISGKNDGFSPTHNGKPMDGEASEDFDWGAIPTATPPETHDGWGDTLGNGIAEFLRMLTHGFTVKQSGRIAHLMAWHAGLTDFKTQAELARALDISESTLSEVNRILPMGFASLARLNRRKIEARATNDETTYEPNRQEFDDAI